MRKKGFGLLLIVMLGLALAACGGGDDGESEAERETARGTAFAPICELTAMSGETGLPADFPTPESVTWVKSEEAGPSRVVEGWAEEELGDLYDDWHQLFEDSDYDITFDEQEDHDAEISFEGGGQSGQVKLADECAEGKVYARVTSRPAD
jgi:hypothetical protein